MNSIQNSSPIPISSLRSVLAAMWLSAIGALSFQVQPILLAVFDSIHGLTDQQIGGLASAELGATFLATISALWWLRKVNWRYAIGSSLLLVMFSYVGAEFASSFSQLLTVRVLGGFGHGAIYVIAVAYICDLDKPEKNFGFAVAVQLLVAAVMFYLLPQIEIKYGVNAVLDILAATTASGLLFMLIFPKYSNKPVVQQSTIPTKSIKLGLFFVLCLMIFQMSLASIWAFIEIMASYSGISREAAGNVLALTVPLAAFGGIAAGIIGLKFGRVIPLIVTVIATLFGLVYLGTIESVYAFFIGFLIQQFFWNFGVAYFYGVIAKTDTNGGLIALAPSAQTLGSAIAPGITGMLLANEGYINVNITSGVCVFLSVGLLIFGLRKAP